MTDRPPPLPPPVPEELYDEPEFPPERSAVDVLIPASNPPALWSYYLGIFSCFPVLGLAMGVAAVILGKQGLERAAADPQRRGRTHAWVGVICGGGFLLLQLGIIIALLVSFSPTRGR